MRVIVEKSEQTKAVVAQSLTLKPQLNNHIQILQTDLSSIGGSMAPLALYIYSAINTAKGKQIIIIIIIIIIIKGTFDDRSKHLPFAYHFFNSRNLFY